MKKLYHHTALSSRESKKNTDEILSKIFHNNSVKKFENVVDSELEQLSRGDVPYIYTCVGSRSIFSDGKEVIKELCERSAVEHALYNLYSMDDKDELFDITLIEMAVRQYPIREKKKKIIPQKTDIPLSREIALKEAGNLLDKIYDIAIPSPDGHLYWGYIEISGSAGIAEAFIFRK